MKVDTGGPAGRVVSFALVIGTSIAVAALY